VRNANGANTARNRVTGISNSTEPSSSKKVTITMATQVLYGHSTNAGNVYATAFYDSDNSAYFANPAATGDSSIFTAGGIKTNEWFRVNSSGVGIYWHATGHHIYPSSTSAMWLRSGHTGASEWKLTCQDETSRGSVYANSSNQIGFLDSDGNWAIRHTRDSSTEFLINDTVYSTLNTDYFTHTSDIRSPIFYDSASTGYYCDPAGTSNLSDVAVTALTMNDNSKAKFGNGNDLEIYHDGTNTNIENDTGYLMIRSDTAIHLRSTTGNEPYISCTHNGGVVLYYNDAIKFATSAAGVSITGTLTASADVIAYSDRKLKKNIKTLDGSKVYDMRGVSFTRKDTGKDGSGIIAQELQKIAPELVSETDGTLGVAYGNITGYLIEAIKDLKAEVEELKNHKCDGCTK
jgi:hypothetical protein